MVKISSKSTTFHKRVFPIIWIGFLVVFVASVLSRGEFQGGKWPLLAMPVLVTALGFFLMKKLVWDLMDEVHDGGNFLLLRKGGEEERVPLSNIMNVSASTHTNPQRVTLRLVKPGRFGSEVAFAPTARFSFNPFAKHPIVEDLIVRVDKARRQAER
jgi:hypothetical protein